MARYYRLTGSQALNNHKGFDLPGNAAARDELVALARHLKPGIVPQPWDWRGWCNIIDIHDRMIVPIADV